MRSEIVPMGTYWHSHPQPRPPRLQRDGSSLHALARAPLRGQPRGRPFHAAEPVLAAHARVHDRGTDGAAVIDFVHQDDREESISQVAGLAAGEPIVAFENRFRHKDGSYVLIAWTATPSLETGLLYAAGHDVTERRRAETEIADLSCALAERAVSLERQNCELERLADVNRAVLDASADGIRLVDLEGRTVLVNSVIAAPRTRGLRLRATARRRTIGRSLADRLSERDPYLRSDGFDREQPGEHDERRVRDHRSRSHVPPPYRRRCAMPRARCVGQHRRRARNHGGDARPLA